MGFYNQDNFVDGSTEQAPILMRLIMLLAFIIIGTIIGLGIIAGLGYIQGIDPENIVNILSLIHI